MLNQSLIKANSISVNYLTRYFASISYFHLYHYKHAVSILENPKFCSHSFNEQVPVSSCECLQILTSLTQLIPQKSLQLHPELFLMM